MNDSRCAGPTAAMTMRILLSQVRLFQRSFGYTWFNWVLAAAALVAPLCTAWLDLGSRTVALALAIPLLLLGIIAWASLIGVLVRLNSPVHARLVPRARRYSARVLALAWLVLSMAGTAALWPLSGQFVFVAAAAGMALAGMALINAARHEGFIPYGLATFGGIHLLTRAQPLVPDLPLLAAAWAASLACGWYALRHLLPRGRDGHWMLLAKVERSRAIQTGNVAALPSVAGGMFATLYSAVLRRACRRPASPGALLMHVFGPRAHWSVVLTVFSILVLVCIACLAVLRLAPIPASVQEFLRIVLTGGASVSMAFLPLLTRQAVLTRIAATGTEQALVRLAPCMPQGRALNRMLANRLLIQAAATALLPWLGYACIEGIFSEESADGIGKAVSIASTALLVAGTLPRNIAALGNPLHVGRLMPVLLAIGAMLSAFAVLRAQGVLLPWPALIALNVLAAAGMAWRNWNAQVNAPVAFPANRLTT